MENVNSIIDEATGGKQDAFPTTLSSIMAANAPPAIEQAPEDTADVAMPPAEVHTGCTCKDKEPATEVKEECKCAEKKDDVKIVNGKICRTATQDEKINLRRKECVDRYTKCGAQADKGYAYSWCNRKKKRARYNGCGGGAYGGEETFFDPEDDKYHTWRNLSERAKEIYS